MNPNPQISRIQEPEELAALLEVNTAQERQRAIEERIDDASRRYGLLAILKPDSDNKSAFSGPINEFVLAELIQMQAGGRLVADRAKNSFYAFCDRTGIFSQITTQEASRLLARWYVELPNLSERLEPLKRRPPSVKMINNLQVAVAAAFGESFPFGGNPDTHPTVIQKPVKNGVLSFNLAADEPPLFRAGLCPSDRALHRAPVSYDPSAGAIPARLMNELLIPALGSDEMGEEFMDDLASAWIGGDLWPFVLGLIGAADSGKSQLVEILRALHGQPHWCALSAKTVSEKFGPAFLSGPIRVVSFADTKGSALTGDVGDLVKCLTGGDFLEDRGPHAQLLVPIKGTKIFVLTANSCPKVSLDDDAAAWERRLRVHKFTAHPVENRIPDFGQTLLRDEGSQILNRLVEGALRRIRLRLAGKRPEMKQPMRDLINEILRRSCAVASYIEPRLIHERGYQINRAELFSMFSDWLKERGWRPWSKEDFYKRSGEVLQRAFGASLSNSLDGGGKGWRSVRFKTTAEIEDD